MIPSCRIGDVVEVKLEPFDDFAKAKSQKTTTSSSTTSSCMINSKAALRSPGSGVRGRQAAGDTLKTCLNERTVPKKKSDVKLEILEIFAKAKIDKIDNFSSALLLSVLARGSPLIQAGAKPTLVSHEHHYLGVLDQIPRKLSNLRAYPIWNTSASRMSMFGPFTPLNPQIQLTSKSASPSGRSGGASPRALADLLGQLNRQRQENNLL